MNPPDQPTLAPTPRTDAAASESDCGIDSFGKAVPSNFARTLETELAAAKAECEVLEKTLKETTRGAGLLAESHYSTITRLRAQESDYVKMIAEVLKCEPRSACEQSDNRLEAPWDVIARLRTENERLKALGSWAHTCIHHNDAERKAGVACPVCVTAELTRLRALSDQLSDNLSAVGAAYNAEKARAEKAEADNAKWQKLLLMSRDDREIDLISEIEEQARLLGMSGEREADLLGKLGRLESELAAIKHGHGELGKYEQLRLKNAELQRDKARLDWLAVSDTWFDYPATESFNPETFRDAIDAAMKGTP
jgi:hypothetical protein